MYCKDCDKEIPYSPFIIRCKRCYALMKKKETDKRYNEMKCLDCSLKIPYSTYIKRCKACYREFMKPSSCHACNGTKEYYFGDDIVGPCIFCLCPECEKEFCNCVENRDLLKLEFEIDNLTPNEVPKIVKS